MANDYTIGSGKLYFDKFDANGVKTGERYFGNTPSFDYTSTYQNLDHYNSDDGVRDKDDSFQLQADRAGTFACDNISLDNVAIVFGADPITESIAGSSGVSETMVVKLDRYYQLGTSIDPDGVGTISSVVVSDSTGLHAYGSITVAANPSAADTVTINGNAITFVSGTPTTHQVQIGANTLTTAQNLKAEVNAYPALYLVTASGFANAIDLIANAAGTGGNSITLAKSGTNPTLSGATLAGGSSGGVIPATSNYTVDLVTGRLYILAAPANINAGDTLQVTFNVTLQSRPSVIDTESQIEGALRFVANNRKGTNKDYYFPRVKLMPSGNYALKADNAWQTMTFNFEVLKPVDGVTKRVYVRQR